MYDNRDKDEIDRITARFFASFTSVDSGSVDLTPLRALFIPHAVITKTCDEEFATYDLESFVAPREALLNGGELVNFSEVECSETTQIFGNIAQRWSGYKKQGRLRGENFRGEGMKSLQFVRTVNGWRLSAVAWDDARLAPESPTED